MSSGLASEAPNAIPGRSRKLKRLLRWMRENAIEYSDGLEMRGAKASVADTGVFALLDLQEGDVIGKIPKKACLTLKTTGAAELLEEAELGGGLGLAAALMYERSKGELSPWFGYLQFLPKSQCVPFLWSEQDIDSYLAGTEIHTVIKEDQQLMREDWEESIAGLSERNPNEFPKEWFTVDHYLAAKSLISSRAFQVDDYHGQGMVPLADMFNHKTAGEHVHFTSFGDSDEESEEEEPEGEPAQPTSENGHQHGAAHKKEKQSSDAEAKLEAESELEDADGSSDVEDRSDFMYMVLVKDVSKGAEVFNTYGELGNGGLLLRYGFTEPDNPFDFVNVEIVTVTQVCEKIFSKRHVRRRIVLWRKTGCAPSVSQGSEYFEISYDGKPETELLLLLFIMHLPDDRSEQLDSALRSEVQGFLAVGRLLGWGKQMGRKQNQGEKRGRKGRARSESSADLEDGQHGDSDAESLDEWLTTASVGETLLLLLQARDSLYPAATVEEDIETLRGVSMVEQPKQYHGLSLRIAERSVLRRCKMNTTGWLSSLKGKTTGKRFHSTVEK